MGLSRLARRVRGFEDREQVGPYAQKLAAAAGTILPGRKSRRAIMAVARKRAMSPGGFAGSRESGGPVPGQPS